MCSHFWKALCLTALPLVCLLAALPASAAPVVPSQVAHVGPHKVFLKHITPDKILRELQWDTDGAISADGGIISYPGPTLPPHNPILPLGVERVYAVETENSLLVIATPNGFNLVKEIVKNLDLAPCEVSFRVKFVTAGKTEVEQSGLISPRRVSTVAQCYDVLMKKPRKEVVGMVTSTTGIPASLDVDTLYRDANKVNIIPFTDPLPTDRMMRIISRVNADDTVSFLVTWPLYANISDPSISQPDASQVLLVTRTVHSGEPLAMIAPPDIAGSLTKDELHGDAMLLAFITPTILVTDENPKTPAPPVGSLGVSSTAP